MFFYYYAVIIIIIINININIIIIIIIIQLFFSVVFWCGSVGVVNPWCDTLSRCFQLGYTTLYPIRTTNGSTWGLPYWSVSSIASDENGFIELTSANSLPMLS